MILTPSHKAVLEKARHLVKTKQCTFVCTALLAVGRSTKAYYEVIEMRSAISKTLEGYSLVTDWLAYKQPEFYIQLRTKYPSNYDVVYRLAWIDHILKTGRI